MSQLGHENSTGFGGITVIISLIIIWIVLAFNTPHCNTTVDACKQIWDQTSYYPLVLIVIVAGVVIGILVKFAKEEKDVSL